jgi:hypothetical protein
VLLRDRVCVRDMCINILHKGDSDDDNNNNNKCMIIPVIIGATGVVTRSLGKNLEAVPGKHSIDSLQQTAILGTAHTHIIRKAL